jgi:hypothetical protein
MEFYNEFGEKIKKVKRKDFDDYAAVDGFSLYNDNRLIHYKHIATTYPYTIIYEYKLIKSNTAFIPKWFPINNYNIGIKESKYSFTYPPNFHIQKVEHNFDSYSIKKIFKVGSVSYSLNDVVPLKHEVLSPSFSKIVPHVKLGSDNFYLAGIKGTADNWNDFGKWMHNKLLASRNNLSVETIKEIKDLVKGVLDPTERAKIIYEYVQNKTRYISVQIEIGG